MNLKSWFQAGDRVRLNKRGIGLFCVDPLNVSGPSITGTVTAVKRNSINPNRQTCIIVWDDGWKDVTGTDYLELVK